MADDYKTLNEQLISEIVRKIRADLTIGGAKQKGGYEAEAKKVDDAFIHAAAAYVNHITTTLEAAAITRVPGPPPGPGIHVTRGLIDLHSDVAKHFVEFRLQQNAKGTA